MSEEKTNPILKKLQKMDTRFRELEGMIQDPEVIKNNTLYSSCIKEHGSLNRVMSVYEELKKLQNQSKEMEALQKIEEDPEMKELIKEEYQDTIQNEQKTFEKLQNLLIEESNENDQKSAIVEIRAGTGGEEASLFTRELYEMYVRYAEKKRWKIEMLDSSPSDLGGLKEAIFSIKGKEVYKYLKYESGGHRVQRIPITESGGRIHTSACTVAVLPEAEEVEVDINPKDLKIDTLRASGPGGQNVNKTSSAIRITHLPTGIVVNCQDTPEQFKNKMKAMRILRTRLYQKYNQDQHDKRNAIRRSQQGSGDRNDRIRTYNYPQNRVTDHRVNVSIYNLIGVMQGNLEEFIESLQQQERAELIQALHEE